MLVTVGHAYTQGFAPDDKAVLRRMTGAPLCLSFGMLKSQEAATRISRVNLLSDDDHLGRLFLTTQQVRATLKFAVKTVTGDHRAFNTVGIHDLRKLWTTTHCAEWLAHKGCFANAPSLEQFLTRCGDSHNTTDKQLKAYLLVKVDPNGRKP